MGSQFPLRSSLKTVPGSQSAERWAVIPITQIEDLQDAVLGAGLNATQMCRGHVTGSLAFAMTNGVTYSSGHIGGRVSLAGPLSEEMITIGVGLILAPGTRHWLNEVQSGDVGVFLAGDDHDALYTPGSLYATVTLTAERLEEIAAQFDLELNPFVLGGTRIDGRHFSSDLLAALRNHFLQLHAGKTFETLSPSVLGRRLLEALIFHSGREPRPHVGKTNPRGQARIVARARTYIHEHLSQSLSIDAIAAAALTSQRTLHRAFQAVLGETPYSYVMKLRLHRIRYEIISDAEFSSTIAAIANCWGVSELGRLSGWYDELFGELPSETRMRCQHFSQVRTKSVKLAASA